MVATSEDCCCGDCPVTLFCDQISASGIKCFQSEFPTDDPPVAPAVYKVITIHVSVTFDRYLEIDECNHQRTEATLEADMVFTHDPDADPFCSVTCDASGTYSQTITTVNDCGEPDVAMCSTSITGCGNGNPGG